MNNILVTGGAGFIGSHLVNSLIRNGYEVLVIDNLSKGSRENVNIKAHFEQTDIRNRGKLNDIFKKFKPDYVFHLAAISSLFSKNSKEMKEVNVLGTTNVLEVSRQNNVKRIIFSSSAAVYGNSSKFPTKENQQLKPISGYGISKLEAESKIVSFSKKFGLSYVILRYSNVYGPGQQYDNEGGVVSIFCNRIILSESVEIYGIGKQTRDFVNIYDVVKANLLLVQESPVNFIANVSTAKEVKINTLLTLIEKVSLKKANVILKPPRDGEINRSCLANSFVRKVLRWQPSVSLSQGVEDTYQFLMSNIR